MVTQRTVTPWPIRHCRFKSYPTHHVIHEEHKLLRRNLTAESQNILNSMLSFRKLLSQTLPPDMVEYVVGLVVKDGAHEKLLSLTSDE